ncbi:MAG: hypothetical protein HQK57_02195, partial [Deltaproteobacteria bacterium]|nr:hypothetical protein [Deltaproteobacteria bacterium]
MRVRSLKVILEGCDVCGMPGVSVEGQGRFVSLRAAIAMMDSVRVGYELELGLDAHGNCAADWCHDCSAAYVG